MARGTSGPWPGVLGTLLAGYGLAHVGDQIAHIAIPLLVVRLAGGSAADTSLVTLASTLPALLFAIPLGVLGDRYHQRYVLAASEGIRAGSIAILACVGRGSDVSITAIALLALIGASGTVAITVVAPTIVASLFQTNVRSRANSRMELIRSLSLTLGPMLGAAMSGLLGSFQTLEFAFSCSVFATVFFARTSAGSLRDNAPGAQALNALIDGLRFVRSHVTLRTLAMVAIAFNIGWFCLMSVYGAYAAERIGLEDRQIGVTLMAAGVGMIVGSWVLPRLLDRISFGNIVWFGPVSGLLAISTISLTLLAPHQWLLVLGFFLLGFGPIMWTVTTTSIRQTVSPPHILSSVSGVIVTATAGARPIGAALGFLAWTTGGYALSTLVSLLCFLFQAGIILRSHVRSVPTLEAFSNE